MTRVFVTGGNSFQKDWHAKIKKIKLPKVAFFFPEQKTTSEQEIFSEVKTLIESADCVIAEVSHPSTAVGGEIVYALVRKKPVLSLFYGDSENKLTPMLAGNPSDRLYLEHYDDDNLRLVVSQFLSEVETMTARQGKLIVIDGGDGSGKTVQTGLLREYLKKKDIAVKCMDFPRYYTSFHGKIVARFLKGEFGNLDSVSPYLASLAYALDRASAKPEMDAFLETGGVIISNRYATSSMAHQGARLPAQEHPDFIEWIDELEYKQHKIPREDVVIYLYVPWRIGWELTSKKSDRKYLDGAKDIMEADQKHRREAENMYLDLASKRSNWIKITCCEHNKILPPEVIHSRIVTELKKRSLIP